MKIRIAGTEYSLKRKAYEIYVQGCTRNCKGCQNPSTHSFSKGKEVDIPDFFRELNEKIRPFIDEGLIRKIFISGGDLLCWDEATVKEFGNYLLFYFAGMETWLFTGEEEEGIPYWIWCYFRIVKCGRYREDLRNPDGTFPASSNQKLIFHYKLPKRIFNETEFMGVKTWS